MSTGMELKPESRLRPYHVPEPSFILKAVERAGVFRQTMSDTFQTSCNKPDLGTVTISGLQVRNLI